MSDPRNLHALFSEVATPDARYIRCMTPPDVASLSSGDLVICEESWGIEDFRMECSEKGIHLRIGDYRYESEKVISRRSRRSVAPDYPEVFREGKAFMAPPGEFFDPKVVEASTAAFAQTWDALSSPLAEGPCYSDAHGLIPSEWVDYLPYPTLNPAQEQALPHILGDGNVMVVAPTGAGKTLIGMLASLAEIKGRGGKAAWLVPQRSLTAELDRELDLWRKKGLKVVALSGETATDMARTQEADLWVATTEKFEALCRASSMREAVSGIGTLVVDEIHLLGEPGRGPLLEALLARVKGDASSRRLIGLSATASNADQVASWLDASLVEIAWRPTRLTQQILTIPTGDRASEGRARNSLAASIVGDITRDGGSTLVFCGTKANVRSTALSIAASRGASVSGVDADDADSVAQVCSDVGVGLHYSDWPHKRQAEKNFRERKSDVLVATSTLAAGVNTPARAVVVRDTSIGPQPMEVSMIQQMFGRAGRAGQESEGWSFVIATSDEVGRLRQRLADGYTIRSGILRGIADHVLGEIVQGHIRTMREAEEWWVGTLAYFQGEHSLTALHTARDFLSTWKFIEVTEGVEQGIKATPLGALTSKMMVNVQDAASLLARLVKTPTPSNHLAAEIGLIEIISRDVEALASTPDAPQDQALPLTRLLTAQGDTSALGRMPNMPRGASRVRVSGSDVVKAGMLLCARSPRAMSTPTRQVAGVNRSLFSPAIYDSPRYLAYLAALGPMGVVPAWTCVVAADLGARIAHHTLAPPRGSGRILRLCERLAPAGSDSRAIQGAWESALSSGCSDPSSWPGETPDGVVNLRQVGAEVRATPGSTLFTERGGRWQRVALSGGRATASGVVAAFHPRGDWSATGWLEKFASVQ